MPDVSTPLAMLPHGIARRVSRRAGLAGVAAALVAVTAPQRGGATKGPKKKTFCLNGETVQAKHKKKKNRLKREGATRGACTDVSGLACGAGGHCRVFATTTFNGVLGGATGADDKCRAAAFNAGLSGSYMAWVGDNSSTPATRFTRTANAGPYELVANTALDGARWPPVVADKFSDLTRCSSAGLCLYHAINRGPDGSAITSNLVAWTGVLANGTSSRNSCGNWTSDDSARAIGQVGSLTSLTSNWTDNATPACNDLARLYCFEQA